MTTTYRALVGTLAASLFLSSCAAYKPKAYIPASAITKPYLNDVAAPTLLATYNALPQGTDAERQSKVNRRNQILQELIALVDQNYSSFESKYYGSDASVNFAGDFLSLSLTGVSAVTGTAHLKAVLSAVATGTTGMKTSYEKNFFDQQTRSAVVEKMRAGRATQLALLQDQNHMKAPVVCPAAGCAAGVSPYSLEAGLSGVAAYYDAGTIIGALQSIATSAGQDQQAAKTTQQQNSATPQLF